MLYNFLRIIICIEMQKLKFPEEVFEKIVELQQLAKIKIIFRIGMA
jgi:hypothetical protein